MMVRFVVLSVSAAIVLNSAPNWALARGNEGSGGGDAVCEAAMKRMIYGEPGLPGIQQFINEGIDFENGKGPSQGSAELRTLVPGFDLHKYDSAMKSAIDSLSWDLQSNAWNLHSVSCIANPDQVRWPEGSKSPLDDKICIAHDLGPNQTEPQILCYSGKSTNGVYQGGLMGMNGQQQFQQLHHELAVFSGFEDEPGQLDNYPLTHNVGAFPHSQTVWVMGPTPVEAPTTQTPVDNTPCAPSTQDDRLSVLVNSKVLPLAGEWLAKLGVSMLDAPSNYFSIIDDHAVHGSIYTDTSSVYDPNIDVQYKAPKPITLSNGIQVELVWKENAKLIFMEDDSHDEFGRTLSRRCKANFTDRTQEILIDIKNAATGTVIGTFGFNPGPTIPGDSNGYGFKDANDFILFDQKNN